MKDIFMALRRYGIILLLALVTCSAGAARAQSDALHEVVIGEARERYRLLIHPAYLTVLHFPSAITQSLISDQKNFIVQLDGNQVILRPMNRAPPNAVANLHVFTADMTVSIFLRITSDVDEAVSQVMFRKPELAGPSFRERLSFSIGGVIGRTTIENPVPGDNVELMSSSPLVGVEARMALVGSSHHSFEAAFSLTQSDMHFRQGSDNTLAYDVRKFSTALVLTRLQLCALFHAGERILPRFRLGGGVQSRTPIAERMEFHDDDDVAVVEGRPEPWRYDVLMIAGTFIDMPIHGNLRAGLSFNAMRSVSVSGPTFVSVEGAAFMRWL